jgi:hypothetical protein
MNQSGKHISLVFLLLLVSFSYGSTGDDQQLKLEIGLSKSTFLVAEPIWLDATLTNVGADTVRIFGFGHPFHGLSAVELKNHEGKILPYTGPTYEELPGNEGWIMKPREQYYGCFNLLELFNTYRGLRSFFWQILPPGSYSVRASYQNISSQEIEFEVVEPTEDEKATYQFLLKADSLLWQKGVDAMRQQLQELINRFPNSVYAEKAYMDLLQYKELQGKFPNSGYNEITLVALTSEKNSKEKRQFLEEVIRDHPGSRSAKFAQEMLKRLKE